jgi:predicted XRE-type DNA-binding protein
MDERLVAPVRYFDMGDVRAFFFAEKPELPADPGYDLTIVGNEPYFVFGEIIAIPAFALIFSDRSEKTIALAADTEGEPLKLTDFGWLKINEEIVRKIESFVEVCTMMQSRQISVPGIKTASVPEEEAVEETEEDKIKRVMAATRKTG